MAFDSADYRRLPGRLGILRAARGRESMTTELPADLREGRKLADDLRRASWCGVLLGDNVQGIA